MLSVFVQGLCTVLHLTLGGVRVSGSGLSQAAVSGYLVGENWLYSRSDILRVFRSAVLIGILDCSWKV